MWISYSDSEVNRFHPVCERALNLALARIGKTNEYRVLHHQYTGSLEMDFAIQNIQTGRYLCVIEVKRTPSDLNSARNQYQAMSYVQMNAAESEKPFYVLTNLEYILPFRYEASRSRVFQQMLAPGLLEVGRFEGSIQAEFEDALANSFASLISGFINNDYTYLVTLEQFESHMRAISNNSPKWKSSLAVLLYEYIRGAFLSVGRND